MKRKFAVILCVIILGCAAVDILCGVMLSDRGAFSVSPLKQINTYVLSPLLWLSVGALVGSVLCWNMGKAARWILRILALAAVLTYAVLALVSPTSGGWAAAFVYWCALHTKIFLLPGLLAGTTMK